MLNGVLTRWELTPKFKFEKFSEELVEYLKVKLIPYTLPDGLIKWECDFNHGDYMDGYIQVDAFKHSKEFCSQKRYLWEEVLEMIIDYTGYRPMCDCDIIEDLRQTFKENKSKSPSSDKFR